MWFYTRKYIPYHIPYTTFIYFNLNKSAEISISFKNEEIYFTLIAPPLSFYQSKDGSPLIYDFYEHKYCIIKNVSSSTSHKKRSIFTGISENNSTFIFDPFPKLCERFWAQFPLKGRGTVPFFASFMLCSNLLIKLLSLFFVRMNSWYSESDAAYLFLNNFKYFFNYYFKNKIIYRLCGQLKSLKVTKQERSKI